MTDSFLSFIPKKDNPQEVSDFGHIFLISSLYKFISKILTSRVKKVLPSLISKNQSDFLQNRKMLDGVLVINEMMDLVKRHKREYLLFKIDFEKIYDKVL